MKIYRKTIKIITLALMLCLPIFVSAQAVNTPFTYQGELLDNGSPANGSYDMSFDAFEFATGGTSLLLFGADEHLAVQVTNGLFSVPVDWGNVLFAGGPDVYLQLAIKPAGSGSYVTLPTRQKITSAPYAIKADFANNANTATNATTANGLNISGNSGDVLTYNGVNWAAGVSLHVNANSGTSVGTTSVPPSNGLRVGGIAKFDDDLNQDLSKAGLPKYMVNVNCGNGINSVAGQDLTGANGSFSMTSTATVGYCYITFPASLTGKFWVVNAENNDGAHVSCDIRTNTAELACQRVDRLGAYQYGKYQIIIF